MSGIGSNAGYPDSLLALHGMSSKSVKLMSVMDKLNRKYGPNTLFVFSVSSRQAWAMRRENMSPCYTTKWTDVPIAHAL